MSGEEDSADSTPGRDGAVDELPAKLRAARVERNLSLRELSRRVGVSPSAISQIENGRARPSVSLLYAIVSELGVSLDALLLDDASASPSGTSACSVERAADRASIELDGGVRWERLAGSHLPGVDFLFVTYPANSSSSPQSLIRHNGFEYGLLLTGSLEVTSGFETVTLAAGDSIAFDSTVPHRLCNPNDEPATGVWFVTGRDAEPDAGAPGHR